MNKTIYYNGNILTMEDETYVEAILIKDGVIINIGNENEILKFKDEDTELIDLKGKTLMPSFIDPHSHITAVATSLNIVNLQGTTTFDEIIEKIKDFIVKNNIKKGQWISGFGFDENFLKEKTYPTKDVLDKASKDNPILIAHASGHTGIANSLALKEFNITSDTKNPEGGIISRIAGTNEPDGHLEENAFFMYGAKIPKATPEAMMKSIEKAQDLYLSYGITTIQDGLTSEHDFNVLKYSSDNKKLKVDFVSYIDIANYKSTLDENKEYTKDYINRLKIGGYKLILDGSPQARTAWLTKPYEIAKDGYCGFPHCTDEQVVDFVKIALSENMQLLAHCNGDAASDQFINSFKTVFNSGIYSKETRPVMIHAQTVRYDQIDEMKQINLLPSYFIAHVYHWGDVHIKNLGMERASRISPAKTTLKKEVSFTFHQDSPVIMPNMLETVWCAVNRITRDGIVLGEFEKIDCLDALKAITIKAAYQYFEDNKKGSIKEGKLANLIILDKDPLTINPMEIKDIKILETIREGEVLYKAK